MKSCPKVNQVLVIRILSSRGLTSLRKLLGVGVGVGLGKPWPTKACPVAYCCVNDVITSVELPDQIPPHYLHNPRHTLDCNGIDLIYTIEHESLQCNVHFTKLIVTSEDIVLDCITVGAVHENIVVPYVGAMFVGGENNALCTIDRIQSGTAFCSYLHSESHSFSLITRCCSSFNCHFWKRSIVD